MAKEPSRTSSSPSASASVDSYIGSYITVTTKSEIRYEGFLYYVSTEDATFGLKHVRLYGTEGRQTNGPQIPPSDKVYDYILFRGSDLKDLQMLATPPAQVEDPVLNDPAIIQSHSDAGPSSSSKPVSAARGSLTDFNLYNEHHSGTQSGIWGPPQPRQSAISSYSIPTQGYTGAPVGSTVAQQYPNASFLYPNATPTLNPVQLSIPFTGSLSSNPAPPLHHSALVNSDGLAMPLPFTYQNASNIEAPVVNKVVPDPVSLLPAQALPYTPSASDPISDPFLRQPVLPTLNQLSQPGLSLHSPAKNLDLDQKGLGVMSPMSMNVSSSVATPAVQPPIVPPASHSQKLHHSSQFTEDFDFQAMNEKFNKDEVWEHLGKANQRNKVEETHETGTSSQTGYSKDDFFDTISCRSVGHEASNAQNRFSERRRLEPETVGRAQSGYGRYGGGRGYNRGPHNRGRGHGGGYMHQR